MTLAATWAERPHLVDVAACAAALRTGAGRVEAKP